MVRAVCWSITSFTAGGSSHSVMPSAFETLRMSRGCDAHAVVGKDGVGGHLLLERDFDRAQRHGQIGGNVGGDAEAVGHVDDLVDAHARGQLEGGNVARLGEGVGQGHRALVVVLVVVRGVAAES